ncbi:hypothetical protein HYALB_00012250 [Hymenoscyphus albidus]|uniref:Uncharacterized protein n=1 Tax=Hymenoscyphus albidus TaxID=595503 RepID=A0A9N9LUW2_9HELO|nr:hypothetical protein HYALB_00012250 [Hymenoscyphus albidus]
MYFLHLLLAFLPLVLALPLERRSDAFYGRGQLIVNDQNGAAIGCLIRTGEFTADMSGCAVFTGDKKVIPQPPPHDKYGTIYRTLSNELGYCGAPVLGPYPAISPIVCSPTMDPVVESQNANLGIPILEYAKVDFTTLYQTLDGEVPVYGGTKQVTPVYGNNGNKGAKYVIVWKAV